VIEVPWQNPIGSTFDQFGRLLHRFTIQLLAQWYLDWSVGIPAHGTVKLFFDLNERADHKEISA